MSWHGYGNRYRTKDVYLSATLQIEMLTDNFEPQNEELSYMAIDRNAVWTNTEYSEEHRIVNGREFLIIQSVKPVKEYYNHLATSGYIEKRVFWVEDKVRYTFSVTGSFGNDEEIKCKEEVDKIVNEWMEKFY